MLSPIPLCSPIPLQSESVRVPPRCAPGHQEPPGVPAAD
jgi:hypothetical protein